jgi:hypothetical protein
MRFRACAVLATVLVVATSGVAHAKSPVQVTPDESTLLVNKFIAGTNEQWVIALNIDDETLTGNVFDLDAGASPTFFFCDATSEEGFGFPEDLAGDTITLDCEVASGCTTLPCTTDWQPVANEITLPGSFFLP